MSNMSVSRDNHYVPQMYLKQWRINSNPSKIYVYRLLVPNENYPTWRRSSIENTAKIKNLYVRIEDDSEYDNFEVDFNQTYETPATIPLEKACNGERMSAQEWQIIINYILAQYVRVPAFFFFIQSWGSKNVQGILKKELDSAIRQVEEDKEKTVTHAISNRSSLIPIQFEIISEDDNHLQPELKATTVVGKNLWLFAIQVALSSTSCVYNLFHRMKWKIITACDGITWPTSDNPVVIIDVTTGKVCFNNDGVDGKNKLLVMPISPRKAIVGSQIKYFYKNTTANRTLSLIIRKAIIENASMYIYCNYQDSTIPAARSRIVDLKEFDRLQNEFSQWYDKYKNDEAIYLKKENLPHVFLEET